MGEPRRIELTTVSAPENGKKPDTVPKTVRFQLVLADSNSRKCPEFSYAYLLQKHAEKKKNENEVATAELDPNDPFAAQDMAEHEKLLALAKSYEAKYGVVKPTKKGKQRVGGLQDMVDLGDGYDETDPFIDNTDAYDEVIPASLTTEFGGFYINSGHLDFRPVSGDEDDDVQGSKIKKRKKKRLIASDSENESDDKKKGRMKKKKSEDEIKLKKKKRLGSDGNEKPLKKKRLIHVKGKLGRPSKPSSTVAELLQGAAAHQNGVIHDPASSAQSPSVTTSSAPNHNVCDNNELKNSEVTTNVSSPKPSTMTQAEYDSLFDSVIKSHSHHETPPSVEITTPPQVVPPSEAPRAEESKIRPENAPPLPETLTPQLNEVITRIKKAAKDSEGKCKFFTPEINKLLLKIEMHAAKVSPSERSIVFAHLAAFFPCSKETLIKRAKKLRLNQQDDKLKAPIAKLKEAIQIVMPAQMERHHQEVQVTERAKMDRAQQEAAARGDGSTESDEESASAEGREKLKRIMAPRKKFEWTPEIRALVCEVVRIKMDTYETAKPRAQPPEEFLRLFLDAEIKPLWPQGWMQTRMLFKETRAVHFKWTNDKAKVKKTVFTGITKPSPSSLLPSVSPKTILPTYSEPAASALPPRPAELVTPNSRVSNGVQSTMDSSKNETLDAAKADTSSRTYEEAFSSITASILAGGSAGKEYVKNRASTSSPSAGIEVAAARAAADIASAASKAEYLDKFKDYLKNLQFSAPKKTAPAVTTSPTSAAINLSTTQARSQVPATTASKTLSDSSCKPMSKTVHAAWLSLGTDQPSSSNEAKKVLTSVKMPKPMVVLSRNIEHAVACRSEINLHNLPPATAASTVSAATTKTFITKAQAKPLPTADQSVLVAKASQGSASQVTSPDWSSLVQSTALKSGHSTQGANQPAASRPRVSSPHHQQQPKLFQSASHNERGNSAASVQGSKQFLSHAPEASVSSSSNQLSERVSTLPPKETSQLQKVSSTSKVSLPAQRTVTSSDAKPKSTHASDLYPTAANKDPLLIAAPKAGLKPQLSAGFATHHLQMAALESSAAYATFTSNISPQRTEAVSSTITTQHRRPSVDQSNAVSSSSSTHQRLQQTPRTLAPPTSVPQSPNIHNSPNSTPKLTPSSTKSFGGLSLEQIQAQTLAKSQKTHSHTSSSVASQSARASPGQPSRSPISASPSRLSQHSPGQSTTTTSSSPSAWHDQRPSSSSASMYPSPQLPKLPYQKPQQPQHAFQSPRSLPSAYDGVSSSAKPPRATPPSLPHTSAPPLPAGFSAMNRSPDAVLPGGPFAHSTAGLSSPTSPLFHNLFSSTASAMLSPSTPSSVNATNPFAVLPPYSADSLQQQHR